MSEGPAQDEDHSFGPPDDRQPHDRSIFHTHTHIYLIDLHQTCINWDQAEIDKTAERISTHTEGDKRGNYFHDQI